VLALAKGESVTARDVHHAWAAWMAGIMPEHRSLIPFDALTPDCQSLDEPLLRGNPAGRAGD